MDKSKLPQIKNSAFLDKKASSDQRKTNISKKFFLMNIKSLSLVKSPQYLSNYMIKLDQVLNNDQALAKNNQQVQRIKNKAHKRNVIYDKITLPKCEKKSLIGHKKNASILEISNSISFNQQTNQAEVILSEGSKILYKFAHKKKKSRRLSLQGTPVQQNFTNLQVNSIKICSLNQLSQNTVPKENNQNGIYSGQFKNFKTSIKKQLMITSKKVLKKQQKNFLKTIISPTKIKILSESDKKKVTSKNPFANEQIHLENLNEIRTLEKPRNNYNKKNTKIKSQEFNQLSQNFIQVQNAQTNFPELQFQDAISGWDNDSQSESFINQNFFEYIKLIIIQILSVLQLRNINLYLLQYLQLACKFAKSIILFLGLISIKMNPQKQI